MDIKGELIEAKFEVRELTSQILATTNSHSRAIYSLEDLHLWINNGSIWKKQLQKEDQYKDFPLGFLQPSMLTLAQFQQEIANMRNLTAADTTWVLCDGQSIVGSDYAILTGINVAPDIRGTSIRMKDHGRGLNPDGDLALGSYQSDSYLSHSHIETFTEGVGPFNGGNALKYVTGVTYTLGAGNTPNFQTLVSSDYSTLSSGGNETRSKTTTGNYFIKINRTVL